jgi:hypothetical protein
VLVAVLSVVNHRAGHDWGDDFALFINQARGLAEGSVGEVAADTRFMLEESGSQFSPSLVPWGFPILLAPVVALWGMDFAMLKLVGVASLLGFMWFYSELTRRRVGRAGSLVLMTLFGVSASYFGWTDTVLSDLPYLCFVTMSLWSIDRCRTNGVWSSADRRPRVWLGILLGFTFSIRREGVVLFVALAVSQLSAVRRSGTPSSTRATLSRLGAPYLYALAFIGGLQLALPAPITRSAIDMGSGAVWDNLLWYRDILAEHVGLKPLAGGGISFLGAETAGLVLLVLFLIFASLGLVERGTAHWRTDGFLIGGLAASAAVVLTLPFHEGRYLYTITPWLVYFAYQGIASTLHDIRLFPARWWRHLPDAAAIALVGALVVANLFHTYHRTTYRLEYQYPHWGPEHPAAAEMFDQVRAHSRKDDVVAFFRARAMNLYSGRRSIQTGSLDRVLARADWYVMAKDSTYAQVLLTDEQATAAGLTREWESEQFVLWRLPSG